MRLLFFLSILTIACAARGQTKYTDRARVKYDGFYQTVGDIDKANNDTSYFYLRFYPNGTVVSVTSEGTAYDLREWFNLDMNNVSIGKYEVQGNKIYFSTTDTSGTVIYSGKINNRYSLVLKVKSLINNYSDKEKYYFVEIPDLK